MVAHILFSINLFGWRIAHYCLLIFYFLCIYLVREYVTFGYSFYSLCIYLVRNYCLFIFYSIYIYLLWEYVIIGCSYFILYEFTCFTNKSLLVVHNLFCMYLLGSWLAHYWWHLLGSTILNSWLFIFILYIVTLFNNW